MSNAGSVGKSILTAETGTRPLASVVVATYKRDDSLRRALQSLIVQTYENIEIIIVDDNADTIWNKTVADIINEFSDDKRIRYIQNPGNRGSAETRNIGIRAACGEYITFLDDDDIYLPEKISHQVNHMLSCGSDYSVTDLKLYNENDKLIEHRDRLYIRKMDSQSLLRYHLMHHITGTDTIMFKKDYLLAIGGFDPIDFGDEFYLIKKAIDEKGAFSYLNRCDVKAYVHNCDGLSAGESKVSGENLLYKFKREYFYELDRKTRRYIKMRHYAVLSFAYIRNKQYTKFFTSSVQSFFIAPFGCIKILLKRFI